MSEREKTAGVVILQARVDLKQGDRVRFAPRWADARAGKVAMVMGIIEVVNDKCFMPLHPDPTELRGPYWLRVVFEESKTEDALAAYDCVLEEERGTLIR